MKLNVNPTRMELIRLKTRIKTAIHGHKLLKEKRDGLMSHFMAIIKEIKELRERVDKELALAFKSFVLANAQAEPRIMAEALAWPEKKITLETSIKNIMGVDVPEFYLKEEGDILCYGLATTPAELDKSLNIFSKTLKDMIRLAEIEHSAKLLAAEIEKTRRRVNALEYIMIPNLQETIKYIEMKLSEQERSTFASLMRIKETIS